MCQRQEKTERSQRVSPRGWTQVFNIGQQERFQRLTQQGTSRTVPVSLTTNLDNPRHHSPVFSLSSLAISGADPVWGWERGDDGPKSRGTARHHWTGWSSSLCSLTPGPMAPSSCAFGSTLAHQTRVVIARSHRVPRGETPAVLPLISRDSAPERVISARLSSLSPAR